MVPSKTHSGAGRCTHTGWLWAGSVVFLVAMAFLSTDVAYGVEPVGIEATLASQTLTVAAVPVQKDGITYLPLVGVARQLGMRSRVESGRVYVDYAGSSAWVDLGSANVNAPAGAFVLETPVIQDGDEVLISRHDLFTFFSTSFRISVRQAAAPALAASTAVLEPVSDEELLADEADSFANPSPAPSTGQGALPVVLIDAGHGGGDAGAEGPRGAREKDIALAVAKLLCDSLDAGGKVKPLLIRTADKDLALPTRAREANQANGVLLVSLHTGASFSSSATGFELFVSPVPEFADASRPGAPVGSRAALAAASLNAAKAFGDSMQRTLGSTTRGLRSIPIQLLDMVNVPGVLVEMGCLTTAADEERLQDPGYQEKLRAGLAEAILAYAAVAQPQAEGTTP